MESKIGTEPSDPSLESPFSVESFWDFVVKRHRIWHKRTILEQPAPWTEDKILQKFFFCNIFRYLDTGTIWYMGNVVHPNQTLDDALWRTITYRLVNSIPAFEAVGGVAPRQDRGLMIATMRSKGVVLNSPAYITLPRPPGPSYHNRVDRLEAILNFLNLEFDGLVYSIQEAKILEEISSCLKHLYGIGPFLSLQIYRDLILANQIPFTDDDWVEIGPGAKKGLLMLFGPRLAKGEKAQRELIYGLTQSQEKPLAERGFGDFETMKISAGDIEHNLCEAGKYFRLSKGRGRRRYYRR